jgi:PTS system mannose-specific IIB component/fructoselysine and glucoselysine-specific PTS system IIB component
VPIVLYRIDERLIHGQVVLGWGSQMAPARYIVVDDDLATSDWEQDLYRMGAGEAGVVFVTVDEARDRLGEWRAAPERSILLTRDVPSMLRLAGGGLLRGAKVNVGGLHHSAERKEVLTYLHLTPEDREDLRALRDEGAIVTAQELPDSHRVDLQTILRA